MAAIAAGKTWRFAAPKRALVEALEKTFAGRPERFSTRRVDRAIYGRDLWPRELLRLRSGEAPEGPAAIVFARNRGDVSDAVRLAREQRVPLVAYAAGSGVCGGARPGAGALVLDLKGLNEIGPLDRKTQTVKAQCGVQGEKLERYLNRRGYTLGHFPSSLYTSTVGGWLSTRSAGQLSTKYGKIEDMALSIEAVLPDGSCFTTPEVPRSAAGPDFKQLLIGAEGTLGLITRAALRVHHYPEQRRFLGAAFPSWRGACEAVREMLQQGLRPAVVRLYDEADTQINASQMKLKIGGVLGVFVCEGEGRLTALEASEVERIAGEAGAELLGEAPARRWWDHRYAVSYNLSKVLPNPGMLLDTIELAASWSRLQALYEGVRGALAAARATLVLCHLSHAYTTGASLYFSVLARSGQSECDLERYDALWKAAMEAATSAGATISHHHGVGELKGPWMEREHAAFQDLFKGIKKQLDPQSLFNPGKLGLPARGGRTRRGRARKTQTEPAT